MGAGYFPENSSELLILRSLNYFKIRDSNGWFWELRGWTNESPAHSSRFLGVSGSYPMNAEGKRASENGGNAVAASRNRLTVGWADRLTLRR